MIRFAKKEDAACLAMLSEKNVEPSWRENDFLEAMNNPQALVFLYEEKAVLGYIVCYFAADEAEISSIAVDRDFRRRGIGDCLLSDASDYLQEKKVTRMFLEVREHNDGAISFYRKNGFSDVGRRRNFYKNPTEDALIMERIYS